MAHPRMYDDASPTIRRLRKICATLPHVVEKEAWGECTFRVDGGAMFAMTNNHPGTVVEVWIKAPHMVQEILVGSSPETFFKPPYVGHKGWVGVRLDRKADWQQIAEMLADGYQMSLPKKLQASAAKTRAKAGAGAAGKRRQPARSKARA